MRKCLVFFICALLALVTGAARAVGQSEAQAAAYAAIEAEWGYRAEELTAANAGYDPENDLYAITFLLKAYDPVLTDGFITITVDAKTGAVRDKRGPHAYELDQQIIADLEKNVSGYKKERYSPEDLAVWWERWQPYQTQMRHYLDEWPQSPEYGKARSILKLALQNIRLPEENDIFYEQALQAGRDSILKELGWTAEGLDMLDLHIAILYESEELQKPVYQFIFRRVYQSSEKYRDTPDGYYEKHYQEPLYQLFGGDNRTTPLYASTRIDAATGKPAEAPVAVFPGLNSPDIWEQIR